MSTACLSHTSHFGVLSASDWTLSSLQALLIPVQRGDLRSGGVRLHRSGWHAERAHREANHSQAL